MGAIPPRPGRRGLLLGLGAMPAAALGGCASRRPPNLAHTTEAGPFGIDIHVVARGWHSDIAIPAMGLNPSLASLARDVPGVRHLVFGFGDRRYLLERDASPIGMLRALLPGRGAILLTALSTGPEQAFGPEAVVRLPVTTAEFDRLQEFLAASLDRGGIAPGDRLPPIADGPYPGSVFHASTITYAVSYTCNTWTIEAMAMAGLPVTASGIVFAHQVMARARRLAALRAGS